MSPAVDIRREITTPEGAMLAIANNHWSYNVEIGQFHGMILIQ